MTTDSKTAPVQPEKDRNSISLLELMHRMRLTGMAEAFMESLSNTMSQSMTPDAFVSWLLAREWDYRSQAAITRLIKQAEFREPCYMEHMYYTVDRNLDRNQMERLASLDFIRKGQSLFITGYSGTGKSYVAQALGYEACKNGLLDIWGDEMGRKSLIFMLLPI